MATYNTTTDPEPILSGKELAELARNYLTLTAVLNWDIETTKSKHDKGIDPTVVMQLLVPGPQQPTMHLPASALTTALQSLAQSLATILRDSGVNVNELLQEYMQAMAPYDQENKNPLDIDDRLV